MKNKNVINTLTIICCSCMIGFMVFFTFWCYKSMTNKKEVAIICNTEIGTDSVLAVYNMNNRLKDISLNEYYNIKFTTTNEGYGYEYKGEVLRMKFQNKKVVEIVYHNSNIDTINLIMNSNEISFNKEKSFVKVCDNFIIHYDGNNKFVIKKNYEKGDTH